MSNIIYVNVNGTWKQADAYYVNVNGTWKTGSEFNIKVSSEWKGTGGGAGGGGNLPSFAEILGLDFVDFTLPTIGNVDSKSSINSLSLDFVDFTLPLIGKPNPN